ncbi:MAG TPA: metal-dependent transcriptional regulator [Bacteroidota bacterium]|nr:metal-dependent transcriptional regulator [Bacteroidota bacterium]
MNPKINRSTEDYVKSIFRLQKEDRTVSTSVLAKHLKIGDGSVTDMLKKLSEKRLLSYEPYQGVRLTPKGRRLALKMVRRHRLWEMFLVRFLDYGWEDIHEEAERLEHVTSDALEERLDKALGYPKVDPHGDPIPTATGELIDVRGKNLTECAIGEAGTIVRVDDGSHEILKFMTKLGLGLNKIVRMKEKFQFDGSVVIEIDGREIPLSPKFAQSIYVEEINLA